MDPKGKVVLITGSTDGVGRLVARRLADQGAHILIHGRDRHRLLLPLILISKPARIVNVSSLGQHPIDFDDVMLTRGYSGGRAYAQSKLAQIMFTFDLAREFDPTTIAANCLHPATYMATTMVRQSGVTPISTVEEGAEAILNLALSKELDGHSGEFYTGLRPSRANAQAYDHRARERLRALSMRLTGLT
jgi:NAD(P)-dependent dehydrogenase (short-subunit alcohol dehydrogenase family)